MLENSHGIQWPFRDGDVLTEDERRLYGDGNFFTPDKKARFQFEAPRENPLPLSKEYPFIFNTGRGTVGQWHTQSRTKEVQFIGDVTSKEPYIFLNPIVAEQYGIKENEWVTVYSVNGQSAVFKARISDCVLPEEIYAPIHYIECNKLTPSIYDAYSKEPSYKATPVRLEKAERGMNHVSD